jgi:hypothetical protein
VQDRRTLSRTENRRNLMFDTDLIEEILTGDIPSAGELEVDLRMLMERLRSIPNMPETEEEENVVL